MRPRRQLVGKCYIRHMTYNAIGVLVGASVVLTRRSHKPEVHEEFTAAFGVAFGRFSGGLLPDVGLFFEIDMSERVVFENRWDAIAVSRGRASSWPSPGEPKRRAQTSDSTCRARVVGTNLEAGRCVGGGAGRAVVRAQVGRTGSRSTV